MPNTPDEQRAILTRLKRLGIVGSQALSLAQTLDPELVEAWSDEYLVFVIQSGSVPAAGRVVIDGGGP